MHSEYVHGLVLRPLMDAGYTAWRDGRRVGIVRYLEGEIHVEAHDLRTQTALVERLAADLRAAGIMGAARGTVDSRRGAASQPGHARRARPAAGA